MALTTTQITNATFVGDGNDGTLNHTYNVMKRLIVVTATAGSTTCRLSVGTDTNADRNLLFSDRDAGRYLHHTATRNRVRIVSLEPVSGSSTQFDVVMERPWDVSDFRAYTDADGNRFDEALPSVNDTISVSIDANDLFRISQDVNISATVAADDERTVEPEAVSNDNVVGSAKKLFSDLTIDSPDCWVVNDSISWPEHCLFVMDSGSIRGDNLVGQFFTPTRNEQSGIQLGRLHPGDTNDADGDYYTSGGVLVYDGSESVNNGSQEGSSIQFVNVVYTTTGGSPLVFLRLYDGNASIEALQRIVMIDTKLNGSIGARVTGNKSFFRNVQYNGGVWRGINFRVTGSDNIFGYIENIAAYDSDALLYFLLNQSGSETTIAGPRMQNPTEGDQDEATLVNVFKGDGNKSNDRNKILNIDDIDWGVFRAIESSEDFNQSSEWYFIRNESGDTDTVTGSYVRVRSTLETQAVDSAANDFDDTDSKLFIYTESSSSAENDDYYETTSTDGSFDNQNILMQQFQLGPQHRLDSTPGASSTTNVRWVYEDTADSDNNKPAFVSCFARSFTPVRTSMLLQDYGPKTFGPTMLIDAEQSNTFDSTADDYIDPDTIDAYTSLATSQELYDYSHKVLYNDPESASVNGQRNFFSKSGDQITLADDHLVFDNSEYDTANAQVFDASLYRDITNTTTHVRIAANTSFDGDLVLDSDRDVTFTHAISGSVTCQNIYFADGTLDDGADVVNGSGTITTSNSETLDCFHIPNGTYNWDGGMVMNTGRITSTSASPDVTIVLVDGSIGGDVVLQSGVKIRKVVSLTLSADEAFVEDNLAIRWVGAQSNADYSSATKLDEDHADVTIEINGNDAVLSFTIDNDDDLYAYFTYDGYEFASINGSSDPNDISLTAISSAAIDFDATYTGDDLTLDGITPRVGRSTTFQAFNADDNDIHVNVNSGGPLDTGGPVSRHFFWRTMAEDNWADGVVQGYVPLNYFTFTADSVVIPVGSKSRVEGNVTKNSDADNTVQFDTRAKDSDAGDLRTSLPAASPSTEVRFAVDASGASGTEVTNIINNRVNAILDDVLDERNVTGDKMIDISLNVPISDD